MAHSGQPDSEQTNFETLVEDYARRPIPDDKTVSGLRIALIIIGIAITIPAFLTGTVMGQSLGLGRALIAFFSGGALITLIACFTARVGAVSRLSTSMIVRTAFGVRGAHGVNALIALTMLGWYGVTAELFGQALQTMAADMWGWMLPAPPLIIVGSAVMIATTMFGFKALDKLSLIAVPVMLIFLITMVIMVTHGRPWSAFMESPRQVLTLGQAISAVAGTFMVGVVVLPDLCRYARSVNQALIASVISFLIGFPIVLSAASIPGIVLGEKDFIVILGLIGLGAPGLVLLVFATWTTNANNLYSASLFLAPIFERYEKWKLTIAAGLAGTLIAIIGMVAIFIPFLLFLGVAIPPIAGIYCVDYFVRKQAYHSTNTDMAAPVNLPAFAAWLAGAGLGYSTSQDWVQLTTIPACDSILMSGLLYVLLTRSRFKQVYGNT